MTAIIDPTVPDTVDADLPPIQSLPPARRCERFGLVALLLGTAIAYLWNITINGMGNGFYAAAAKAGSTDWKALLFGSLDTGNFITVDKPPLSQWVMALSGQIFGFSSASMLVPQALMAVATVALLCGAVTRVTLSRGAGLLAGAALAVMPVAALMFRFNNPDAVMVLCMTVAAYCTVRALPSASARWMALAGVALGFAFLAKMLEGLMVLPALGLAYLIVAPTTVRARLVHLLGAAVALVVSSGWYIVLTILWPASSRPYLAGSTNNTFMDLVLGYNGFARFLGHNHHGQRFEPPPGFEIPHNAMGGGFGGGPSPWRMFTGEIGFEISWLLPAALVAFVLLLVSRWGLRPRAPRTDLVGGATLVFGLWLLINGGSLSAMKGGMHAYYSMSIAPAVAALIGLGVHEMWLRRAELLGKLGLAALIAAAGGWGFVLLARYATWMPPLRWAILGATLLAVLGLVVAAIPPIGKRPVMSRATAVLVVLGLLAGFGGSTAYALTTLGQKHTGGSPTVGPKRVQKVAPNSPATQFQRQMGQFMEGNSSKELVATLRKTTTTWSAAVDRSSVAATLELSSDTAVMAIGGFTGEDPVPTLAQFQDYVREHRVTYYLAQNASLPDEWRTGKAPEQQSNSPRGQRQPGPGGWWPAGHKDIADWVAAHYQSIQVGSFTVYDLSAGLPTGK